MVGASVEYDWSISGTVKPFPEIIKCSPKKV